MKNCLICEQSVGAYHKILEITDYAGTQNFSIMECPACRILKTDPIPDDLGTLYEDSAFDKPQGEFHHFLKGILIRREIKRIVTATHSKGFLDMGSGHGNFSENLHKLGYSAVATDSHLQRPYYIRSIPQIPYKHFDYNKMLIEDPACVQNRTVVLRHVLEHIRDPKAFLQKFISWGAAYFYIAVPNAQSLERLIFREHNAFWHPPFHIWHYHKASMEKLLNSSGLEVIRSGHDTIPSG